jgi:CheY-like chemotaxis protein
MHQANAERTHNVLEGLTTNFRIIPIAEIPAPEPSDAARELRPLVLVVDGGPAVADGLTEILDMNGYAVIGASDAETALETALLIPPDLAVIDARLLGSSGIQLATSLREKLPDCIVLMMEGDAPASELLGSVNAAHVGLRGDGAGSRV